MFQTRLWGKCLVTSSSWLLPLSLTCSVPSSHPGSFSPFSLPCTPTSSLSLFSSSHTHDVPSLFLSPSLPSLPLHLSSLSLFPSSHPTSPSLLSAFAPMWSVLKDMCEKLSTLHSQFVQSLSELTREIAEYNNTQKDKLRINVSLSFDHPMPGVGW